MSTNRLKFVSWPVVSERTRVALVAGLCFSVASLVCIQGANTFCTQPLDRQPFACRALGYYAFALHSRYCLVVAVVVVVVVIARRQLLFQCFMGSRAANLRAAHLLLLLLVAAPAPGPLLLRDQFFEVVFWCPTGALAARGALHLFQLLCSLPASA